MLSIELLGNLQSVHFSFREGKSISTAPKQLNVLGIGTYIKIVFLRPPPKTNKNPNG
jgi:hypothetical protein